MHTLHERGEIHPVSARALFFLVPTGRGPYTLTALSDAFDGSTVPRRDGSRRSSHRSHRAGAAPQLSPGGSSVSVSATGAGRLGRSLVAATPRRSLYVSALRQETEYGDSASTVPATASHQMERSVARSFVLTEPHL